MPKFKTLTACWKHYGVKPTNIVWSWTACDEANKLVVMTFWSNEFEDESMIAYRNRHWPPPWGDKKPRSPGYYERLRHLAWARDNCDGEVRVILIVPKDLNQHPHRPKERETVDWRMRVESLDTSTGNFRLVRVGSVADAGRRKP